MALALCNMGDIVIIGNGHQKLFLREVGASSLLKLLLLLQRKKPPMLYQTRFATSSH